MRQLSLFIKTVPALLLVPTLAFSASAAGKVRSILGDVYRQKASKADWTELRVGNSIYQTDRVRTGFEANVVFALPDGSLITIAENAEVEMSKLLEEDGSGAFRTRLDVKKGYLNFAVEKLREKNSTFEFKTGTATAAIRGTQGFIGGDDVFFASLETGKLDIQLEDRSKTSSITAGETVFGKDSLVTLKLASSGKSHFAKKVRSIVSSGRDLDAMVQEILKADVESVKEEEARSADVSQSFTLGTTSPVSVCKGGFLVEGSYQTADSAAKLVVKVGTHTSENLIRVADGARHNFSHKVPLNDDNRLWNEKVATVTMTTANGEESKSIELSVDKTCSEVNRISPSVKILSYDSLGCRMQVSIANMRDDAGIFTFSKDGSEVLELSVSRDEQKRLKMSPGIHEYEVKVVDQAGNESRAEKTLGCYPSKRFNIDLFGKSREVLKIPPPPKDMADRIPKTLEFRIKSPENDPSFLYKVTVKQNGKVILQEVLSQIQSLDYRVPLELTRNAQNRFDIEVVHKSGFVTKARKIYEVR